MRTLLWLMVGGFALAGAALMLTGLRGLWAMALRRNLLVRAVGTVRAIEKKLAHFTTRSAGHRHRYAFLPVITFTNEAGETVEFRSEVGDMGERSPYSGGQTLDVLYDPSGVVSPMIDEWFARWGVHILMIVGGVIFSGGAALVYWLLGQPQFAPK